MDVLPWYRQPWPWFLIALPAIAVVGSVITAAIAMRGNDDVVAPDYYRRGLAINQELERLQRAAELGIQVELSATGVFAGDRMTMRVVGRGVVPPDAALRVYLIDRNGAVGTLPMVIARTGAAADGHEASYTGVLPADLEIGRGDGVARVVVESSTWRVDTTVDVSAIVLAH
jgi:hypothetical protein